MTQYPRDRFDDVPAYSNRKGNHREGATTGAAPSGLLWVSLAAAFSLVVGAFCYLVLPSLLPADAASAPEGPSASATPSSAPATPTAPAAASASARSSVSAAPTATPTATPTPTPTPTESESTEPADTGDTTAPVEVYNSSRINGLAGQVTGALSSAGFSVVATGNWQGFNSSTSAVYYSRNVTTASAAANRLGLPLVYDARVPGVAVVLAPDYAGR